MTKRIRRLGAVLAALLLGAIGAAPAEALTLSPNPLVLVPDASNTDPNFRSLLTLVDVVNGIPVGGSVLSGSVSASDVTLVFEASLDASAAEGALFLLVDHPESLDSAYAGVRYTGAGRVPGGGHDIDSASLAGTYAAFILTGAGLAPGASADLFFLSIPSLSVGTPFLGAIGTVGSYGAATATFVPEPGTSALLAFGLAMAGVAGGRGRRSRRL
jgi:hypothetical protein